MTLGTLVMYDIEGTVISIIMESEGSLSERIYPVGVPYVEFPYGSYRTEFSNSRLVRINTETKEPIFEPYVIDLAVLKSQKQQEILSACDLSITYGFQSDIKGGVQPYYLTNEIQKEIDANLVIASQGKPVPFKNANQRICDVWTAEEFTQFWKDAVTFATMVKFYKDGIMEMIESCSTEDDFQAISWGMQLSHEIQANIDATIQDLQG